MEALLGQLPYAGVVISIIVIILGVAAGLYMLADYRDKKRKEKTKEQNEADDRLNSILEKTVKDLSGKVDKLEKREVELTKEVGELRKENEKYLSILQGRDAQTQEFYKQAFDSMKVARDTHELVSTVVKGIGDTNTNMKSLIELIGKHVSVIDHSIAKQP